MKTTDLVNVTRQPLIDLYNSNVSLYGSDKIIINSMAAGSGKTFLLANSPLQVLNDLREKYKTPQAMYVFSAPSSSIVSDLIQSSKDCLEKILKTNVSTIMLMPKSDYTDYWKNLEQNYDFQIVHTMSMVNFLRLSLAKINVKVNIIIATTNQTISFHEDSFKKLANTVPSFIGIDEAHTFLGVSTAELYYKVMENSALSFTGKYFKLIHTLAKNAITTITAYTGTPTMEHRGKVTQIDGSPFKYVLFDKDDSSKKNITNIRFLSGYIKDPEPNRYYPKWGDDRVAAFFNAGISKYVGKPNKGSFHFIKLPAGSSMRYILNNGYRYLNENAKNVLFYHSDSKIKLSVLNPTGYRTIGKSLKCAKKLLLDKSNNYNTICVINAGSTGWDLPPINEITWLSSSAKQLEQYNFSQTVCRGNRVYEELDLTINIRLLSGTRSALKYLAKSTYETNGKIYNTVMDFAKGDMPLISAEEWK
jgi:hypothetical protein